MPHFCHDAAVNYFSTPIASLRTQNVAFGTQNVALSTQNVAFDTQNVALNLVSH